MEALEGTSATITGWGKTSPSLKNLQRKNETGAAAPHLRTAVSPIANKICEEDEELKKYFNPEVHVCAGQSDSK